MSKGERNRAKVRNGYMEPDEFFMERYRFWLSRKLRAEADATRRLIRHVDAYLAYCE